MVSSLPRKSELMRRPTSVSRSTASRYRKRGSGRASAGALMVVSLLGFVDQSDGGKSIGLLHAREYIGVVADLVSEPQAERARNGHLEAEIVLHVGVVGVALDQKPVDDLGLSVSWCWKPMSPRKMTPSSDSPVSRTSAKR